ncbi:TPA_asm: UL37.6 uoORF [Human alphaherpesvirus 1]|nr:TPA_asm: UL37.6 uoORF [Human alphaherpesvirus 1]
MPATRRGATPRLPE